MSLCLFQNFIATIESLYNSMAWKRFNGITISADGFNTIRSLSIGSTI